MPINSPEPVAARGKDNPTLIYSSAVNNYCSGNSDSIRNFDIVLLIIVVVISTVARIVTVGSGGVWGTRGVSRAGESDSSWECGCFSLWH